MAGLKISYAAIPYNSKEITSDDTLGDFLTVWDVAAGPRHVHPRLAGPTSSWVLHYDVGTNYEDLDSSADHFILARSDYGLAASNSVTVECSDNDTDWTTAGTNTCTATGSGLNALITFSDTGQHRYWRNVWSTLGVPNDFQHSKLYFGSFLTPDYDPDYDFQIIQPGSNIWYATSGTGYSTRTRSAYYEFNLVFPHQSDATVKVFEDKIVSRASECPVFLYESAEPYSILDGRRLVHVQLIDYRTSKIWSDLNTIDVKFRELIG